MVGELVATECVSVADVVSEHGDILSPELNGKGECNADD